MSSYGISVCKSGYYYDFLVSLENNDVFSTEVGAILTSLCNLDEKQFIKDIKNNYDGKDQPFNEQNGYAFLNWMENELKANKNVGDVLSLFLTIEIADMLHSYFHENGKSIIDWLRNSSIDRDDQYKLKRGYTSTNKNFELPFQFMSEFISSSLVFLEGTISMARDITLSYCYGDSIYSEIFTNLFRAQSFEYHIAWFNKKIMPVYKINNLTALIAFELNNLIELGLNIKKCAHCKRFFVPLKKSDEKYCPGMSKVYPSLSCKEAAKRIKQQNNLKNSEPDRLRRTVYNTLRNRLVSKKAADDAVYEEYEKVLQQFSLDASEWRKNVISGIAREEDYINWLKSFQKRNN